MYFFLYNKFSFIRQVVGLNLMFLLEWQEITATDCVQLCPCYVGTHALYNTYFKDGQIVPACQKWTRLM